MTPKERAYNIAYGLWNDQAELTIFIAQAIRDAVAEEREACARLFERNEQTYTFDDDSVDFTYRVMAIIAHTIRARGGKGE